MIPLLTITALIIAALLYRWAYRKWGKPPKGYHFASRNGKRFVRRNPKQKTSTQPAEVANEANQS